MENETQEEEGVQVEQKSVLHQVTPLSKYLALALFVILPFLGGWIGYTYAPEKVVEKEKFIEVEKIIVKEIEAFDEKRETLTTIRTSQDKNTSQGTTIKDYKYRNGSYTVDFSFESTEIVIKDHYRPGSDDGFYSVYFYESAKDMGELLLRYFVHGGDSVLSGTADGVPILSDTDGSFQIEGTAVNVAGSDWKLYGAYKRCDIGGCDTAEYLYSKMIDEYRLYLLSDISLHEDDQVLAELSLVLGTLQFETE